MLLNQEVGLQFECWLITIKVDEATTPGTWCSEMMSTQTVPILQDLGTHLSCCLEVNGFPGSQNPAPMEEASVV